ncbi:MAG: hypothetical protein QM749_01645 [Aquabacterium sp.]
MSLPFVAPTEDTHAFNYHALDEYDFSDAEQASRKTQWSATLGITSRTKTANGPRLMPHPQTVAYWREASRATIAQTAARFGVSTATVKRYCAASANV